LTKEQVSDKLDCQYNFEYEFFKARLTVMSKDGRISVIITTYNRKECVQKAVLSVLSQTRLPDEVLLIDDGSTDGTESVVTQAFPQVRYFWQENRGIGAARNAGIENASHEWIAFLDSDDAWLSKKLENQINALETHPNYLVCHTNEIWIRRGRRVNPRKVHQKFGGHIFEKCLPLCVVSPSSVLIHRQVFETVGLFDPNFLVCEDYDLWLRMSSRFPVLYLDQPLIVKYGGHADQLSRKYWGMDRFRIAALEKILANGRLNKTQRTSAVQMLLKKMDIYIQGARKRGKKDEILLYSEKRKQYECLLTANDSLFSK